MPEWVQDRVCNWHPCRETDDLLPIEVSGGGLLGYLCEQHAEEQEYLWRRESERKVGPALATAFMEPKP